jgi:hypothetical protein
MVSLISDFFSSQMKIIIEKLFFNKFGEQIMKIKGIGVGLTLIGPIYFNQFG